MVGWKETFEVLPAILVVGISFATTQFLWANYVDSNLVDIAAGVVSLVCTVLFLKIWHPKNIWRFEDERTTEAAAAGSGTLPSVSGGSNGKVHNYTGGQIAKAWLPFAILSIFVLVWGLPQFKTPVNKATTPIFDVPHLHNLVLRDAPVVSKPTKEAARYDFNWLTATGTACFLAAIVAGLVTGLKPGRMLKIFGHTLYRLRFAVLAIAAMLGLGFVTRYSGTDAVLGLAFTHTGWFYPFFGTFLGWLGVALTGSDTSSNALFGSLQRITAQQLNISPTLMCAANSAGGVMGKMVDAQSICIATAATNQVGNEGQIFRFVVWHSVALGSIVGIIVMFYAYVMPHLIPQGLHFVK
jgi:lactate permease